MAIAAGITGAFYPLASQELVRVAGEDAYCDCRVTFEHVVTLGDTAGPGVLLGPVRQVRRSSHGVYHVLAFEDDKLYRFTADGTALPPLVERGQGPGEALAISSFLMVADSVLTFDPRNGRMMVFDPSGGVVRTVEQSQFVYDGAYFPSWLVVNARGNSSQPFGFPLHTFDHEGRYVRSYGSDGAIPPGSGLRWLRHVVGETTADAVWSAEHNKYVIEEWSTDGRLLRRLERQAAWFPPREDRTWGGA